MKLQSIQGVHIAVELCISADCTSPRLICKCPIYGWFYAWNTTRVRLALLTAHSHIALHVGHTVYSLKVVQHGDDQNSKFDSLAAIPMPSSLT